MYQKIFVVFLFLSLIISSGVYARDNSNCWETLYTPDVVINPRKEPFEATIGYVKVFPCKGIKRIVLRHNNLTSTSISRLNIDLPISSTHYDHNPSALGIDTEIHQDFAVYPGQETVIRIRGHLESTKETVRYNVQRRVFQENDVLVIQVRIQKSFN